LLAVIVAVGHLVGDVSIADGASLVILFDEADALFSKRTEVKGAIDRYANLEVNYLLQRVERFGGITILTTNLDASIDPALIRRLAAKIRFDPPEEDERLELWRRMLDTGAAPLADDIDYLELARRFPDMTGANIRNAAIAGAFLAASEGAEITSKHIMRAAVGEYRSMGRVVR
jgi:SpoVK/Ycf46/Vps4 family AAA+-type ATPase